MHNIKDVTRICIRIIHTQIHKIQTHYTHTHAHPCKTEVYICTINDGSTGKVFFHNKITGTTSWRPPEGTIYPPKNNPANREWHASIGVHEAVDLFEGAKGVLIVCVLACSRYELITNAAQSVTAQALCFRSVMKPCILSCRHIPDSSD